MLKFIKAMEAVVKDEAPEAQSCGCGCGPRKAPESVVEKSAEEDSGDGGCCSGPEE